MLPALADEGLKVRNVKNVVADWVELDGLTGDCEERFGQAVIVVFDDLAEMGKGLAQIVACLLLGVVGP
jgi:hypothetical protein